MEPKTLFRSCTCSACVAAVCCFTPLLVVLLPALGLGAWLAWADYVLWSLLVVSLGAMAFAGWRIRRQDRCCSTDEEGVEP